MLTYDAHLLISHAVSMRRRNTWSKPTRWAFSDQGSFASADSSGTPSWLGDLITAGHFDLYREALFHQLFKWCCIDRLSWHGLPDIEVLA
jgi:hypothetical protein